MTRHWICTITMDSIDLIQHVNTMFNPGNVLCHFCEYARPSIFASLTSKAVNANQVPSGRVLFPLVPDEKSAT